MNNNRDKRPGEIRVPRDLAVDARDKVFNDTPRLLESITDQSATSLFRASHTAKLVIGPGPSISNRKSPLIFFIGGQSQTSRDGSTVINLNNHICMLHDEDAVKKGLIAALINQPWFTATPISDAKPILITIGYTMRDAQYIGPPQALVIEDYPGVDLYGYSVEVKVNSWNPDGGIAPNIYFSWQCIIEGVRFHVES